MHSQPTLQREWLIKITDNNLYELMRGGRARWKIENETFNTLKNQGYQFEHNFGHGKKKFAYNICIFNDIGFFNRSITRSYMLFFQKVYGAQKNQAIILGKK